MYSGRCAARRDDRDSAHEVAGVVAPVAGERDAVLTGKLLVDHLEHDSLAARSRRFSDAKVHEQSVPIFHE